MPYKPLTDSEFVEEMRILWRDGDEWTKRVLQTAILQHFDCGGRGLRIIEKMKEVN